MPTTPPSRTLALCLHGKLGAAASASLIDARPKTCKTERANYNASLTAHARLAHHGLWKHVVLANRNAGVRVGVFMHSWNPMVAGLLDALYSPEASVHEASPSKLDAVRSQHLSMARVLALVPISYELVLVTRWDVLFFSPLLVASLPAANMLWLPQHCHPVLGNDRAVTRNWVIEACGCMGDLTKRCRSNHREIGRGAMATAPYTTRNARMPQLKKAIAGKPADYVSWVLDFWFVASRAAAITFGDIYHNTRKYRISFDQLTLSAANRKKKSSAGPSSTASKQADEVMQQAVPFPNWAHFFWAAHIHQHFRSGQVGFAPLMFGIDFILARKWWVGVACETPTNVTPHAARLMEFAANRAPGSGWFKDPTLPASWRAGHLSEQCPSQIQRGQAVLCDVNSPGCRNSPHSRRVAEILGVARRLMRGKPSQVGYGCWGAA